MSLPITLQEVLTAIGGPLREQSLWALLYLGENVLQEALTSAKDQAELSLLVSPESMLLYHGGSAKFLQGIQETSQFTAPEHFQDGSIGGEFNEKSYVYSLGITLFAAMQHGLDGNSPDISEQMHSLLLTMVEPSVDQRASLSHIESVCQNCSSVESAEEEVDMLVSYVLGPSHELSSSEYGETDLDDANLETEFQQAITIKATGSVEHLYSPSYGSRASSSLSINSFGPYHRPRSLGSDSYDNLYSSLPAVYHGNGGSQDQLSLKVGQHITRNWSSFDRLDSRLQPSEVELLASKAKSGRQLSASRKYGTHLYTPTRARKQASPPGGVDVHRSSSFTSPGFYRSSSDNPPKVQRLLPKQPELHNDDTTVTQNNAPSSNEQHVISATPPLDDIQHVISATPPLDDIQHVISATPPLNDIQHVIGATPPLSNEQHVINATPLDDEQHVISAVPPLSNEQHVINTTPPLDDEQHVISTMPPFSDRTSSTDEVVNGNAPSVSILPSLSVDDMPPLPPPMISDTFKQESHVIHNEVEVSLEDSLSPPPLPADDPPMFSPDDDITSPDTPSITDNSFDYSQVNTSFSVIDSPAGETKGEDDFEFSFPEAPPPPTMSPPQDESYQEDYTSQKDIEQTTSQENVTHTTGHGMEEVSKDKSTSKDEKKWLEHSITPRRALDEAFDELDRQSESSFESSSTEEKGEIPKPVDNSLTDQPQLESVDSLYAKVDLSKKTKYLTGKQLDRDITPRTALVQAFQELDKIGESQLDTSASCDLSGVEGRVSGSEVDGLYTKIDITKKTNKSDDDQTDSSFTPTISHEGIRRASSVDTVPGPDYAIVHHPKRSSMPPDSIPDTEYEEVAPPIPPRMMDYQSTSSLRGRSLKGSGLTSSGSGLESNKSSLKKLSTVFGPEFESLSGVVPKRVKMVGQMPDGRRAVKVVMLNGHSTLFIVERDSLCRDLFQQVVAHQGLHEKRIFGLAVLRDRDELFLEFDSKLLKYAPSGWVSYPSKGRDAPVFTVFFRVKYYVENVSELNSSQARHLYYLQLRKDILEGKMYCHEQPALELAALALQAEKGDVPSTKLQHVYYRMEDYVPIKSIDRLGRPHIESLLPTMHAEHKGMGKEMAELEFLKVVQTLSEYGMVFYRVARSKRASIGSVWLGFSVRGIVVFDVHKDVKTPVSHCPWKKIENLSFSNRKFIVELQGSKPLVFYTNSYKKARHLLHLSMSYHRFQLLSRGLLIDQESSDASPTEKMATETKSFANDGCAVYEEPQLKSHDHDYIEIRLLKGVNKGLGINIGASQVAVLGSNIVVEEIMKDGPAHLDGKLMRGDVLLSVNGISLDGLTCQETAEVLRNADDLVILKAHRQTRYLQSTSEITPYAELTDPHHSPFELLSSHATVLEVNEPTVSTNDTLTSMTVDDKQVASLNSTTDNDEGLNKTDDAIIGTDMTDEPSYAEIVKIDEDRDHLNMHHSRPSLPDGTTTMVDIEKVGGVFGVRIAGGIGKTIGHGFIYVKAIVEDSPAQKCNLLAVNDIFLEVNGKSMIQTTHREAATHIQQAQGVVHVRIHRLLNPSWMETDDEVTRPVSQRESWSDIMTHTHNIPTHITAELAPIVEHEKKQDLENSFANSDQPVSIEPVANSDQPVSIEPVSIGSCDLDNTFTKESDVLCSISEPHLLSGGEHNTLTTDELETTHSETLLHDSVTERLNEVGVFSVTLKKGFRGLGFMLNKPLSGQQGHGVFVLKVNDDPARKDGRLKPGDEIIQVNEEYLAGKSHKEAIAALRLAQGTVTLYVRREVETEREPPSPPNSPLPPDMDLEESSSDQQLINGDTSFLPNLDDTPIERIPDPPNLNDTPPSDVVESSQQSDNDPMLADAYPPLPESPLPLEDDQSQQDTNGSLP